MADFIRGLEKKQEQNPGLLIRDTRTLGQRIRDFLGDPRNGAIITISSGIGCFFFQEIADLIFVINALLFGYCYTRKTTLPFRLPKRSNLVDYNDLIPGRKRKPRKAGGICFIGNEKLTNEELWFTNEDMRTHVLIFGSTGSGKTETLLSLSFNALVQGSGFIYVDGKGDNSIFVKIFSMARFMGREDDILLINFMTGARDIIGPQKRRLSNTLNPFSNGSSSMLAQLITGLMDKSSGSSDGDMWKGRAIGFVEALMRLLVYMRDQGKILLDANIIRNYFDLTKLESIHVDRQFVRPGEEPISLKDVPPNVLEPIDNYMMNLPGYNRERKGKQVSQVLEQHGFITMQLTRVFTSLADTYGHILRTNLAEVDLKDVVFNRRILVVLLPALEKSPDELSSLGKVIIATLKAIMAGGLGEEVEGTYRELIAKKQTTSPTPFICILDEYGYYAVEGFAVVPAQARSLGFCVIFAGQDLPALQKASKEEAASIGANCNIKIAMKIEDPTETWDFFSKTAGESYVTKVDSYQSEANSIFNTYRDTRSSSAEKRARVDLLDLKDQLQGDAHIFFQSTILRARMFYANPKIVKYMRLNYYLKVDKPKTRQIEEFRQRLRSFKKWLDKEKQCELPDSIIETELDTIIETYHDPQLAKLSPIEQGIKALMRYAEASGEIIAPEVTAQAEIEANQISEQLDVFSRIIVTDFAQNYVAPKAWDYFSSNLLRKPETESNVLTIQRLLGRSERDSREISKTLINDMKNVTSYTVRLPKKMRTPEQLVKSIHKIIAALNPPPPPPQ